MNQRLGYLSGAPRVSTNPNAEATGPRSHVVGVIRGFESLNWEVKPFIVGDRVPQEWVTKGSERAISGNILRTLAADLTRLFLASSNARRAWKELGNEVDWVYERFASFQSMGFLFKKNGIPWILETNAPLFYEAKTERKSIALGGIAHRLEIHAYRNCDVLVSISEALKEILVKELGIPSEKILVVPNGVDTAFFDPAQHQPKRMFKNFTIGFVGTFRSWAGLDLLFEVMSNLKAAGTTLSLVAVGDGPMRASWEQKVDSLGLSEDVVFTGRVPWQDVPSYIAGFDVCYSGQMQLQVGKMYLSPLKLYEYMSMGKPVVASAFEDARRLIESGETGFLFAGGNANELRQSLIQAYNLKELLPKMGQQARERIIANHSWSARISRLTVEVEKILGV